MCLADLLAKVEIKDMNVRFYTNIGNGDSCESVKFMTRDYDITSIPKPLLLAKYSKCTISEDLIRVYL